MNHLEQIDMVLMHLNDEQARFLHNESYPGGVVVYWSSECFYVPSACGMYRFCSGCSHVGRLFGVALYSLLTLSGK